MKTFRIIGIVLISVLLSMNLVSCSNGSDDPIEPTPTPEVPKSEITIDSDLIANGLSFSYEKGEQSISFITNGNWTLSVAATTSGTTWCNASVTSGSTGTANVKFTVTENTDYEDRSVSITIKSGTATKTFKITQKSKEALLVTTNKYEVSQEGGTIDIEVKANIEYKMEISEKAKEWIKESESRGLTTYKHTLDIAENPDAKEREGEVYFKSGDKVETVKVYQIGSEAVIMLSKNEYTVSDQGETISVDIKSNIEFGVKMPNVNWIADEASSRGLSSHTLRYVVKPNDTYDSRSAEIIFYAKNSDLKETLKIIQTQKDAIVISKKEYEVKAEGETIEVELNSNVDFELSIENDWIKQVESKSSRALVSHKLYFQISKNESEKERNSIIHITDKNKNITESIIIKQKNKEDNTPYLTFQADAAQTLTMSKAVETLEYSVDGGEWNTLGTTTVTFGGNNGDLRLRGKSSIGTANSTSDYAQIEFGTDAAVACTGDIRTLVDYENYDSANTEKARFSSLFRGCSVLATAPELLATVLAPQCYNNMFNGCINLTTAPELPSMTLSQACYQSMFADCRNLTVAPKLPAIKMVNGCYNSMFFRCTSLVVAPQLPAKGLANNCYSQMFYGCTNLSEAPSLPATTLSFSCYDSMFADCTSLTTAPELPATILTKGCYSNMFAGCTKLNSITMLATDISAEYCLENWVQGVAPTGTFTKDKDMKSLSYGNNGIPEGWTVKNYGEEVTNNIPYLSFNTDSEQTLKMSKTINTLEYSVNNSEWNELGTETVIFGGNHGTLRLRGQSSTGTATANNIYSQIEFGTDAEVACTGDIRTLVDYMTYDTVDMGEAKFCYLFKDCATLISPPELPSNKLADMCYYGLFSGCTKLATAPELPAKTISYFGYFGMFERCISLTTAPQLPATALNTYCYGSMFKGCTNLATAPNLPASTLAESCYDTMFSGCTNLETAPELPATTLASSCYNFMFVGCTKLTSAPQLPATILKYSCYQSMFSGCIGLTSAPQLPATSLDIYCYESMFQGCTGLKTAPQLPATTLAQNCYTSMFSSCTGLKYVPKLPATTLDVYCYSNMFNGCTSLEVAPEITATTMAAYSCYEMFKGCTNLTKTPELPATTLADGCYTRMFAGCTNLETAYKLPALTLKHECYFAMFSGCTKLKKAPELPATSLASSCYESMFSGCTSLITAPQLTAVTLARSCYEYMFQNCTSLSTAPELPASKLMDYCYNHMFYLCKNLSNVTMLATDVSANKCLDSWLYGVSSTGTFTQKNGGPELPDGSSGIPKGWTLLLK